MQLDIVKAGRLFILLLLVLLVLSVFVHYGVVDKGIIKTSDRECVASICIDEPSVGMTCSVVGPEVFEITVILDLNGNQKFLFTPTGTNCTER